MLNETTLIYLYLHFLLLKKEKNRISTNGQVVKGQEVRFTYNSAPVRQCGNLEIPKSPPYMPSLLINRGVSRQQHGDSFPTIASSAVVVSTPYFQRASKLRLNLLLYSFDMSGRGRKGGKEGVGGSGREGRWWKG